MGKKVFITGAGGYLGQRLMDALERAPWCERVYGMDVKAPLWKFDKLEFRRMDINAPELVEWVKEIKPDIMVHLAFVLDPIPDEALMTHINVDGAVNALKAAAAGEVRQVLVASSGTAYGAWPDNPVPLKESDAIRIHPTFRYATDKGRVEQLLVTFMKDHPEVMVSIIRPCVVYGPLVNNYLSGLMTLPVVVAPGDFDPPLQFIHEDDVAGAVMMILEQEARGAFNLAPPDTMTLKEAIALSGRKALYLPAAVLERLAAVSWWLQVGPLKIPPSFLDYMRYPWVLDTTRVTEELGYRYRYSTRETFEIMLRAKKVIV